MILIITVIIIISIIMLIESSRFPTIHLMKVKSSLTQTTQRSVHHGDIIRINIIINIMIIQLTSGSPYGVIGVISQVSILWASEKCQVRWKLNIEVTPLSNALILDIFIYTDHLLSTVYTHLIILMWDKYYVILSLLLLHFNNYWYVIC